MGVIVLALVGGLVLVAPAIQAISRRRPLGLLVDFMGS
jgi:hypothetical protein